jgi:hypothetical protein
MSNAHKLKPPPTEEDTTDLRDLMAIQAMSGILAGRKGEFLYVDPIQTADSAYAFADAMLKVRSKK